MPVYFDKDKKRWRYTFNRVIAGQRHRATKLLPEGWSRSRAEGYDRTETARLYAVASGVERPEPTVGDAVSLYLEHRLPLLRNRHKIARDLALLVDYIDGVPISALGDISRRYVLDNKNLAAGTLHNRLAYLKAACRYAWRKHGLTEHDPTARMEIPRPNNAREVRVSVKQLRSLVDRITPTEARALFWLSFRTGSRWVSEIHCRVPDDVERHGRDFWIRVGLTKNGSPRMVPVAPDARWTLAYLPFKRSKEYYYARFVEAREAEGLKGMWIHDMRHVLASDIISRGGTLSEVQEALHHKSQIASARYAHLHPGRLKQVLFGVGEARKVHTSTIRNGKKKAA